MNKNYFITGTDTDVGKTFVSELLLKQLNESERVVGYKPIAAGADMTPSGLRNDAALILQNACREPAPYDQINPICFEQEIAPHIAAKINKAPISVGQLNQWWDTVKNNSELSLIEGAGGWRLPLNDTEHLSDFVQQQNMQVIVVVGMKLGCLNHALLTIEAIKSDGLHITGWVANQLATPMAHYQENLDYLTDVLEVPVLAEIKSNHRYVEGSALFSL